MSALEVLVSALEVLVSALEVSVLCCVNGGLHMAVLHVALTSGLVIDVLILMPVLHLGMHDYAKHKVPWLRVENQANSSINLS